MVRHPNRRALQTDASTEVLCADALAPASLAPAMAGIDTAYYLIHSMGDPGTFEEKDREAAINFSRAAKAGGVKRIIYLGGLGNEADGLSDHLRSRQEIGVLLRQSGVQVLEFRASIVIGAGSLSFEMIRSLVERLPVMITPRWVSVAAQPIYIEDLLNYLAAALMDTGGESRTYEIGGADQVSYAGLMRAYATCRGLHLRMLPVPLLTPHLSSLWLGLVTPLYARVGRRLIEGVLYPTVVRDHTAEDTFAVKPVGIDAAVRKALETEDRAFAAEGWYDAIATGGPSARGMRLIDSRSVHLPVSPTHLFEPVNRIGGDTGWYAWNGLWKLRGFLDRLVGGVGMRKTPRSGDQLKKGDTIDFWRVEVIDANRRLRLRAEMKLPGHAWLEFEVAGTETSSRLRQTAMFDPVGFWGRAYWWCLYPLHALIFRGMLKGIAKSVKSGPMGRRKP